MTRLALVGLGLIGREHAQLIVQHTSAQLCAVCDPAPESVEFARSLAIPDFSQWDEMLDSTKPDGVVIALPNQLHEPVALSCIRRGIACLIEKPIAESLPAAWRITLAAEQAGCPVLIGHQRRHSPDICEAKKAIDAGDLGPVIAVNGMTLFDKPDDYFKADWRTKAGGGVLLINLIHDIDVLRYLVGEIESIRAFTSSATRGFEVEDTASLAIRFQNGALGTFIISDAAVSPWAWEYTSGQALYHPSQPGASLFIAGRKAALSVPDMYMWRHARENEHWQHPLVREYRAPQRSLTYVNQLEHFMDVAQRKAKPLISARDGMNTLAATLAVARAGAGGESVRVSTLLDEARAMI